MRQTDLAGHQLVRLIMGERYRATSPALRHLMTELRQRETKAFNEHVAQLHEKAGTLGIILVAHAARWPGLERS
jgi:hypothetical protein